LAQPLEGRRVALAESRQLEELAQMLEKDGAVPLRYPLVGILDAPDEAPIREWLHELIAGRFAYVALMTGEALRRLVGFAERAGLRDAVVAALSKTRTITRGPKPGAALRELGLVPTKIAEAPTTAGVIATLRKESPQGQTVGFTLYGEANPTLVAFLESVGATARPVLPYVYAPAADAHRVVELIRKMAAGEVDAIIFTSSAQSDRLFEVAKEHNLESELRQGLDKVRVAAVGPIMAETLHEKGVRVDVCPEQGFVMKNLVTQLGRAMRK
jgi:uroporphyrinogen-III synthase